jgi:hypothetical protein
MFLRYVSESRMKNDGLSQISKMKGNAFHPDSLTYNVDSA